MKLVLLDTATLGEDIDLTPVTSLGESTEYKETMPAQIASRLVQADIAVLNKLRLNEANLAEAKHLKLICVTATGYDNIDINYCRQHHIAVCNVPGYSTDSVAQLTVAMALSLVSRLTEYRQFVHSGSYTASGIANCLTPVYHELSSMTWGILGGGAIGSRVAKIATAMGAHVLMCRRQTDDTYEQVTVDELCHRSDILSLHVPLTEETKGMIHRERIASMKPGAILINMARGAVTDEKAIADAIQIGHLGGFGSDVYTQEPFATDHPFVSLLEKSNVCLTPHMAWGSAEARTRCVSVIADNIRNFVAGNSKNRIV